jgi:uncharacterized delta-60 repeat protein
MGVRRLLASASALGALWALGALAALAACNALTGVGDLAASGCADCGEGGPSSPLAEGGGADAFFDGSTEGADGGGGGDALPPEKPGGFLDPTFGTGGVLTSQLLVDATCVAVRSDGKIYIGGSYNNALAVLRLGKDGTADMTFGTGGQVIVPNATSSHAYAIAIDSQGRAVVAGSSTTTDPTTLVSTTVGYLVRIGESAVDGSFGSFGRKNTLTDGEVLTSLVVTTSAGDFAAAGRATNVGGVWAGTSAGNISERFDVSYVDGVPATIAAMTGDISGVTVVGGSGNVGGGDYGAARVKVGGYDTTFANGGRTTIEMSPSVDVATAVVRLSDGSVVVGGQTGPADGTDNGKQTRHPLFGLARLTTNGAPVAAFGTAGKSVLSFAQAAVMSDNAGDYLAGMVADARDAVIAVGYSDERVSGLAGQQRKVAMSRVTANGQLDPLFGTAGKLQFAFEVAATASSRATAVATQPDGKLVVVGSASTGIGVARVTP